MFNLAASSGFAALFAVLCLGCAPAHAQAAPVRYWIPAGPFGFGGSSGLGSDSYANFPSFNVGDGPAAFLILIVGAIVAIVADARARRT